MPIPSKIGAACLAAFGFSTGASAVTASYLQVAGGGGGGRGGGGGAGGMLTGTTSLVLTTSYTVTVGAGGTGASSASGWSTATNGSNSSFTGLTASVGGGAGGYAGGPGNNGGSGGGASNNATYPTYLGGLGTAGQGNNGGSNGSSYAGGGGGGASAVGGNGGASTAGAGGNGTASSITGSSVTYAGGGGGSGYQTQDGVSGGTGGGGSGGTNAGAAGGNGTANLGGGGGAGHQDTATNGGSGGSGIVIISYTGAQQFGGGTVTSSGGSTIHTFTSSGVLSPLSSLSASYLIVAGGGGGQGGGAGAGGYLASTTVLDTNSTYTVVVGAGGSGGVTQTSGSNSSFSTVSTTAVGGGKGASFGNDGTSGGSGGGAASAYAISYTGGAGTSGQGNAGGSSSSGHSAGGGGGGAGAVGSNTSLNTGGNGGNGSASSISGSSVTYAGGGGGGGAVTNGSGGTGGGGAGSASAPVSGTVNTGGGGGGSYNTYGAAGGSGIVIISYAGSTQQMAGGSVTITGGNVIHTFTSSGYLTPLTYYSNSLRFRSSASAYLLRTPTTTGSTQKLTWSGWVKYSTSSTYSVLFSAQNTAGTDQDGFYISNGQNLSIILNGTTAGSLNTTQLFRDPAAWYHLVLAIDTTQATASDRIKLYVNGSQVTAFSSASYPSQNYNFTGWNVAGRPQFIGTQAQSYPAFTWNGYMSNINFIDGQALTPNSFGTFNSYGVWQPINYGGSYGTNGFYLPFIGGSSTYSASFNGSSQYLGFPNSSNLAFGTGAFTIEGWVYATSALNDKFILGGRNAVGTMIIGTGGYLGSTTAGALRYVGSSELSSGSTLICNSNWNHFAIVRDASNNVKLFVNGILSGSGTDTTNYSTTTGTWYVGVNDLGQASNFFTGNISNLRVVKGYALYTGNFIPTTSPLTTTTGCAFLSLQSSTLIDNSGNSVTITNNGSVTTSASVSTLTNTYALAADKSPQGNNWTPNNISNAPTSTYDSMTDVPTLTSATAANTCTYNPLNNGGTVTNGNLRFSNTAGAYASCAGTIGVSSGKFYWEVTMTTYSPSGNTVGITASTEYWPTIASYVGSTASSYGYYNGGTKYNSGAGVAYGASYTTGDVIGVALDMTAGTLIFYKNGVSQGTAYTGLTGTFMAGVSAYNSGTPLLDINFGQQPFVYTPPSTYVALNTYNL